MKTRPGSILESLPRHVAQKRSVRDDPRNAALTPFVRFFLAHLGDSRAYVVRGEEMVRISQDHTWVQEQIDEGRLSEQAASVHPWRNVVLRSVNAESDDEPERLDHERR